MNTSNRTHPQGRSDDSAALQNLLGTDAVRPWWKRGSVWLGAGLVVAAAAGFMLWSGQQAEQAQPRYQTEAITRGNVALTVTANGKLQPTRSVSVGSELSGTVTKVLVDVNDRVTKGQVLVELDTAKLRDQITSARAALASAEAAVAQSVASVKAARSNLQRLEEVQRLSGGQVPSAADLDAARATLDQAVAAEAANRANVQGARATLSTNETNLAKASIRSPIDGVVLTRAVDPGNAVAASLQAVTLFTLAEDLSRLQLSVNVDEADVGRVQVGQSAGFTVSAWPGRKYPANIVRVAYGSTITDNVVTYTTLLDVANPDLSLRPGMTATASIAAAEHRDVLLVPAAALRWSPTQAGAAAGGPGATGGSGNSGGGIVSKLMPRPPSSGQPKRAGTDKRSDASAPKQIWVLQDGRPQSLTVQIGLSNGRVTEVLGDGVREGLPVITGLGAAGAGVAR